ncbi:MAG: HAD family hydrolase [Oenococcus oeni]
MELTFDCYGTLLDTSTIKKRITEICDENHINALLAADTFFNYEDRFKYTDVVIPYEKLIKKSLKFVDMDLMTNNLFLSHYQTILQAYYDLKPFPEVNGILAQLKKNGNSLYLMSNSSIQLMKYNLRALNHIFDEVFTADDTKCYKPQLDFFDFVQNKLHFSNDNHIHIAKGFWWDIVPSSKISWKKIWINRNHLSGLKDYQPYKELPNLSELPTVIHSI